MVRHSPGARGTRLSVARRDGGLASLIVIAELPQALQSHADQLRRAHYPPERNQLPAHVTLFHALPPSSEGELRQLLATEARTAPIPARLDGLMNLGRGTALAISSPAMLSIWERVADRFHGMLTPQDERPPLLHVTIQNKVSPREARTLQASLAPSIEPRAFAFTGLALHRYRGGPWELVKRWPFRG